MNENPQLGNAPQENNRNGFVTPDKHVQRDELQGDTIGGVSIGNIEGGFHRNIIAGQRIIANIVNTGDHNQFFVGDYERLRDAYINPGSVFDRINLEHFIGREWLLAEVDSFLQIHDRGYFILEADAGLGKTAFMAWLARHRHYIHHFSELAPGQEGIGIALRNLAAQLALAYELRPEGVLPSAATRPDYLYDLLKQAANQRREDEKIVLIVDALDEAGTPLNQNVLGLPAVLPPGVYVIASQRPVAVVLRVETTSTPRYRLLLTATEPNNQADMRRFLARAATWPRVAQTLQENHYTAEQFTSTLLDKCRGVWIYLHYVVHEIVQGERSPLDLAALPNGMTQYYVQYWQRWRNADETEWDEYYLPVLNTLAAAQEALSCQQLLVWSGAKRTERTLRRLLEERWRPFLAIDKQGQEHRYRFYHATLQEFFDGRLAQDTLSLAERSLVTELAEETRACHARLAERYLQAWGGLAAVLPGLQEVTKRDLDQQYGLRHVIAHLAASGRVADLHYLLRIEWVRTDTIPLSTEDQTRVDQQQKEEQVEQTRGYRNAWYTVREAVGQTDGYLADVIRAWRLAEKDSCDETDISELKLNGGVEESWQSKALGLQCRYALIIASVNSLAHNILPKLLIELVKKKLWLPQQGLAYARQIPDLHHRAEALANLAPYLSADQLQEALRTAQSIEDLSSRAEALANLAPYLSADQLQEALRTVQSIKKRDFQAKALTNLAARFVELGQFPEALRTAQSIEDLSSRAQALTNLAPHLSAGDQEKALQEALRTAQSIEDLSSRAEALANLAPHLSAAQLQEALRTVQSIKKRDFQAKALTNLAARFVELGQFPEALRTAQSIEDLSSRAQALTNLAPHLSAGDQEKALQEALRTAQSIEDLSSRAEALANLAPHLSAAQLQEALRTVQSIEGHYFRAKALANLAPYLSADQLQEALRTAQSIKDTYSGSEVLAYLAPYLSTEQLQEALCTAQSIEDHNFRAQALANLAPHLSAAQLQEALRTAKGYWALVNLAPYLSAGDQEKILQEELRYIQSIKESSAQAELLAMLARHFSTEQLQEALRTAQSIEDHNFRAQALANLAPHLSADQLPEALRTVQSIEDHNFRAQALANLAPYLSTEQLQEALRTVQSIEKRDSQAEALANLAARFTELGQIQEALRTVLSIKDRDSGAVWDKHDYRAETLAKLVVQFAELGQLQEALRTAQSIENWYYRAEALANLAARFAEVGQLQEALRTVQSIEKRDSRAQALTNLAPYLPASEQEKVLQEALRTVQSIEYSEHRGLALANLAPYLSTDQLQEALRTAQSIESNFYQAQVWANLAPYLSADQLQEALRIAQSIKDTYSGSEVLAYLAPYLSTEQLQEALRIAQSIKKSDYQAKALANLAPYLSAEQLQEALHTAQSIKAQAEVFNLAVRFAELGQLQEALRIAQSIKKSDDRARVLANLAPHLPAGEQEKVLQEALRTVQSIENHYFRAKALANLAARFAEVGQLQEALRTAQSIEDLSSQAAVLANLVVRFAEVGQLQEALSMAQSIEKRDSRAQALADLAPQLIKLSSDDSYALWCKTLPVLSGRTRADLLADLVALAVLIAHLGGAAAVTEIAQAIQDVGCWWP